jgi:hypothetical protein
MACIEQYQRNGIIKRALDAADDLIRTWVESEQRGGCAAVADVVTFWTWVSLRERIARSHLTAAGYDIGLLDIAWDGEGVGMKPGITLGDLDALLDEWKGREVPDEVFHSLGVEP